MPFHCRVEGMRGGSRDRNKKGVLCGEELLQPIYGGARVQLHSPAPSLLQMPHPDQTKWRSNCPVMQFTKVK